MNYFFEFEWSGESFEQRIGDPESLDAAIGKVAANFSALEHGVMDRLAHTQCISRDEAISRFDSLSFRERLDSLTTTLEALQDDSALNLGPFDRSAVVAELRRRCVEAHALHDLATKTNWGFRRGPGLAEIVQPGIYADRLKSPPIGVLTAGEILDIADFIICVAERLDELFLRAPTSP